MGEIKYHGQGSAAHITRTIGKDERHLDGEFVFSDSYKPGGEEFDISQYFPKEVTEVLFLPENDYFFRYTGKTVRAFDTDNGNEASAEADLSSIGNRPLILDIDFSHGTGGDFKMESQNGEAQGYSKGDEIEMNITIDSSNESIEIALDGESDVEIDIANAVYESGEDLVDAINDAIVAAGSHLTDASDDAKVIATWTETDAENDKGYITLTSLSTGVGSSVVVTAGSTNDCSVLIGLDDPEERQGGTAAIDHDSNAATLKSRIETLVGVSEVTVSHWGDDGEGEYTVFFAPEDGDPEIIVSDEDMDLLDGNDNDPPEITVVAPFEEKGVSFRAWGY